jgi:putative transposase
MRIVTRVSRQVQVSAGGVCGLGYHVMWCPKYRRLILAGRIAARCEGLIGARAGEHGWRVVALEIMPDQVHLFVKAHPSDSPSRIASQFNGFISRFLRAGFAHLRSRLPALWSGRVSRRPLALHLRRRCAGIPARRMSGGGRRKASGEARV